MTRAEILEKMTGVFRAVFDDDSLVITEATTADDIEDWDSLEQINILAALGKLLNIKFTAADVEDLANVGDMVSLIEGKL